MRRLRGAFVAATLAVGLVAGSVQAQPASVESAKAAVDASDYLTARTQLTELVAAGTSGPAELAELYRLTGIVAGALGDAKAATDAFERCLVLAPKATLPPGTSPKIARPFAEAQAFLKAHEPLKIKAETAATPPAVTITIVSDPLAMVARARVIATVDGKPAQTIERPAGEEVSVGLPAGARIDLRVAVLDDKGNRLAEVGSIDVPLVIVGKAAPLVPLGPRKPPPKVSHAGPSHPRPLYLKWWLWGGTSVAFAAAGTYFGLGARSAKQELDQLNAASVLHSFDEAKTVEDRGKRDALLTNIAFGAAGTLAAVAVILYLTEPRTPEAHRVTTVTPVPVQGGGAIVLGVPF